MQAKGALAVVRHSWVAG